ncbi:MAG: DNA-3-methyladenine glycosylase 2 family protein [Oscillospiraceae bacterium]|nr:DNA-3-methyladenine glycosylase 2 family protein [Oscillospiraceae bacterium]
MLKQKVENITYKSTSAGVLLKVDHLNLGKTLDCGQAFRWEAVGEGRYHGYYVNRELYISKHDGGILFENTTEDDFKNVWYGYFDLGTDWREIRERLSTDPTLKLACEKCEGLRILRQDPWEGLISFIISQNNNIPRIKSILSKLVEHFGGFPTAEELALETSESLQFLHSGYRARYLVDAARMVSSGEISLEACRKMSYPDAKKELMRICGVGSKVADCTLLYGLGFMEAFPVDVWIKRAVAKYYPDGLPECTKGIEGIAQLFLFDFIRSEEA